MDIRRPQDTRCSLLLSAEIAGGQPRRCRAASLHTIRRPPCGCACVCVCVCAKGPGAKRPAISKLRTDALGRASAREFKCRLQLKRKMSAGSDLIWPSRRKGPGRKLPNLPLTPRCSLRHQAGMVDRRPCSRLVSSRPPAASLARLAGYRGNPRDSSPK